MGVYTRTDVVMVERLLPDGKMQAGIYASAYRLLDAVNVAGFLFSLGSGPILGSTCDDASPRSVPSCNRLQAGRNDGVG